MLRSTSFRSTSARDSPQNRFTLLRRWEFPSEIPKTRITNKTDVIRVISYHNISEFPDSSITLDFRKIRKWLVLFFSTFAPLTPVRVAPAPASARSSFLGSVYFPGFLSGPLTSSWQTLARASLAWARLLYVYEADASANVRRYGICCGCTVQIEI